MEAVMELCEFVAALLQTLLALEERWRKERAELLLQMLCVSHRCLVINGDCRPLLSLMQQLLPHCHHVRRYIRYIGLYQNRGIQSAPALYSFFRICHWTS